MDELASTPVSQYTDERSQLAASLSDTTLTESERSDIIDRYINASLSSNSDLDPIELQPMVEDELAPWVGVAEVGARFNALALDRFVGGTQESSVQLVEHQADPIMLFTGQYTHRVEDIRIPGAGIDFVFQRTYKNQTFYDGPMGHSWDHNYNLWLTEVSATLLKRSSGELREDRYTLHPDFGYFQPPPGYHDIIEPLGDSFQLRLLDGKIFGYERIASSLLHRLAQVTDRYGNFLFLYYDGEQRLTRVDINSRRRFVTFSYDPRGRISLASDHCGRTWEYEYDDEGDLVRCLSPPAFPNAARVRTDYEYSSLLYSGALKHNLLRVHVAGVGTSVENEYGAVQGSLSFNRVVRQRLGGAEALFEYEDILPDPGWTYSVVETPTHLTREYQPDGHQVEHLYNSAGNLVARRETARGREGPRKIVSRYRYNADGALIGSLSNENDVVQYWYGRDDFEFRHDLEPGTADGHPQLSASERLRFGLLLSIVRRSRRHDPIALQEYVGAYGNIFPDPFQADAADIAIRYAYEPTYGRLANTSDPRFTTSADPRHREVMDRTHQNYAQYNGTLTRYYYSGPGSRYLARIEYPRCTRPDGSVSAVPAHRYEVYDTRGRLIRERNEEGEVTHYRYFDASAGPLVGFLAEEIRDPDGLKLTTRFTYTPFGVLSSRTSPSGYQTTFEIDDLGWTRVKRTPDGGAMRFWYDADGRVTRQERDVILPDGTLSAASPETRTYEFDAQGRLLKESLGGTAAPDLVTRHRYDGAGNRIETVTPRGTRVGYDYDPRSLLIRATRAPCTEYRSSSRTFYDGEQRKVFQIDARGYRRSFRHDCFGRLVAEIDPLGNVRRWTYDKCGRVVCERFFERTADGAYWLLSRSAARFDERGRKILEASNCFDDPVPSGDPVRDFVAGPGPGTLDVRSFVVDGLGRTVVETNARGHSATYGYDSVGRLQSRTDALGNWVEYDYDRDGNVQAERHHSVAPGRADRVYETTYQYDPMGRRSATQDALGNQVLSLFDTVGNCVWSRDALGRVSNFRFDVYGRMRSRACELSASGLAGPAVSVSKTTYAYDANGNRARVTDPAGNVTRHSYDPLDRATRIDHADGTWQASVYDPVGNLIEYSDSRGISVGHYYDPLNRKLSSIVDLRLALRPIACSGSEYFRYDALGRLVFHSNDTSTVEARFDSRGRCTAEHVRFADAVGGSLGVLSTLRRYDAVSNRTLLTYPNGREVRYRYDELDRIDLVRNESSGSSHPGRVLPSNFVLVSHSYDGTLAFRSDFGNRAATELHHDAGGRPVQIAHLLADGREALVLQYLFDACGNVRIRHELSSARGLGSRYSYDSLNRLVDVAAVAAARFDPATLDPLVRATQAAQDALIGRLQLPVRARTFRFDLAGNRLEVRGLSGAGPGVVYDVVAGNRYSRVDAVAPTYDGLGCVSSQGGYEFTYDQYGRLVSVRFGSSELVRYGFDATGRRVLAVWPSAVEHTVFDGSNPLVCYLDGLLVSSFVNENGPDTHCQMSDGGDEYWVHKDAIGSTAAVTDHRGLLVGVCPLEPYGTGAGSPPIPARLPLFMGRRFDRATGLFDFRTRAYFPDWGRFLQRDTKDTQDPNLYCAFANNPLAFVDPFGTESVRQMVLSSVEQNIREGNTWTAGAEYVGYFAWNALTFGFVEKNSDSYERYNGGDYVLLTVADVGRSAAILGVSVATGGAAGGGVVTAVGQTGASATLTYAAGGAVGGAVGSAASLGVEDLVDVVGTGYRDQPHSVRDYAESAALGATVGLGAGALQGNALARGAGPAQGPPGEEQASAITGQPRNVGPGRQALPVSGRLTPTGRPQTYIPDQPANPTATAEGTLATRGTIVEVKNYVTSELSTTTANMPKALAVAQANGVPLECFTSQNTRIAPDMKAAVANGDIIWRPSLNPLEATGAVAGAAGSGRVKPSR